MNPFSPFPCCAARRLLGALASAQAAPSPTIHMSHNVEYMSGGIGKDEAELMQTVSPRWPATFEFAVKDGNKADFAADVRVTVRDSRGMALVRRTGPSWSAAAAGRLPGGGAARRRDAEAGGACAGRRAGKDRLHVSRRHRHGLHGARARRRSDATAKAGGRSAVASRGLSAHILPTSATMIGVCMTVLSIGHLHQGGRPRVVLDKLLAIDALVFLASAVVSFLSIRSRSGAARLAGARNWCSSSGSRCWRSVRWCSPSASINASRLWVFRRQARRAGGDRIWWADHRPTP